MSVQLKPTSATARCVGSPRNLAIVLCGALALAACSDANEAPKAASEVPRLIAVTAPQTVKDVKNRADALQFGLSTLTEFVSGNADLRGKVFVRRYDNFADAAAMRFELGGGSDLMYAGDKKNDPAQFGGANALPIYVVILKVNDNGRFVPTRTPGGDLGELAKNSGDTAYTMFSPTTGSFMRGFDGRAQTQDTSSTSSLVSGQARRDFYARAGAPVGVTISQRQPAMDRSDYAKFVESNGTPTGG